jgi:uncharacterized protein YeaO (DUF488 family)
MLVRSWSRNRLPIKTNNDPMTIRLKRVYEKPEPADGTRILVDRLWPRGLTKEKAAIDLWLKEVAPSTELRRWFGHDPRKWRTFRSRYRTELRQHGAPLQLIKSKAKGGVVTLVYGARDQEHNEAVILRELLTARY